MRFIVAFLKYEFKRIFGDRRLLLYLAILLLILLYCIKSGVDSYGIIQAGKEHFKSYEKKKQTKYVNYTQYAGSGFRVFFEPSPLFVFFNGSGVIGSVESNVDTSEVLKVAHSYKGRDLFAIRGNYKDFAGVISLLGSLFMLYMGVNSFVSIREVKFWIERKSTKKYFFGTLLTRMLILAFTFLAFFGIAYLYVIGIGIELASIEKSIYVSFCLFAALYLLFFFSLGVMLKVLVKFRGYVYAVGIVVWFILIFAVPEVQRSYSFQESLKIPSNSEVDLDKLGNLMTFEGRIAKIWAAAKKLKRSETRKVFEKVIDQFMNNYYLLNKNIELTLFKNVEELISTTEVISIVMPTAYFSYFAGESSSKGYRSYLDFRSYVMNLRARFIKFYCERNFAEDSDKVESFINAEENIYFSRVYFPEQLWWSIVFILFYIVVFIHISYVRLRKQVYR